MTPEQAAPLLRPAVSLRRTRIGGYAPVAWAGQLMRVGPRCAACGSPRMLVLVADVSEVDHVDADAVTVAVCPYCDLDGDDGARTTVWSGTLDALPDVSRGHELRALDVQTAPDGEALHALVELPDPDQDADAYQAAVGKWQDALIEAGGVPRSGTQIGGHPAWIQGEATPACPEHGAMRLFVQLDGEDADMSFGDDGRLYAFRCAHAGCDTLRVVVQGR